LFLLLLAGCAGKTAPSVAPVNPLPSPPPDREFPVAIHLTSYQITPPATPLAAEAVYGHWLRDQGHIRTWVRVESPRIHLALVDETQGIGRVMDGEYTLAKDGSIFGVISTVMNFNEKEKVDTLFRGESPTVSPFLPEQQPEKCCKPFLVTCRVEAGELVLDGEALFQGRYRKTAETRPTFARPVPPLGKWENRDWENKVHTRLHLSDQIELEMVDQITGRRLKLAGRYAVTAGNLLYGTFTMMEQSETVGRAWKDIPPQLFCFRYAVAGANQLQIRDIVSACFDDKAKDLLQRDYHKEQESKSDPEKNQRRGGRRS
jgi:hypothetical protein